MVNKGRNSEGKEGNAEGWKGIVKGRKRGGKEGKG